MDDFDNLLGAIGTGQLEPREILQRAGDDLNRLGVRVPRTCLMAAALDGRLDLIRMLSERGASISVANEAGFAAIHEAAVNGDPAITAELIRLGAAIDCPTKQGVTALMIASAQGHYELVVWLVEHGAALDLKDCNGQTAAETADEKGELEIAALPANHPRRRPKSV